MIQNLFLLIFVLFVQQTGFCTTSDGSLPNILWIVSEDNSPFLGAYGDSIATTPNIDQFASEGVLYENAFAVAPVCSPTRSTLITGVYATSMGTEHMRSKYPIPGVIRFFPEYLRKAGYYTTNNFKTDYNTSSEDERMEYTWDESSEKAHYKNRKDGQPFFSVFNLTTTHESSIFKNKDDLTHDPERMEVPPYLPSTPEMKHDWACYYDNIERMDIQVGELLKELEELGLSENTIVFYFSDHGGILGRSKQYLYDSGLHVPLIIRFPKVYRNLAPGSSGTRTDRLVSFVDFAPTILSLAGIQVPEYIEGKAFLGDQQSAPRDYVYSFRGRMDERNDLVRGVRSKDFFYRRNFMPHRIYGQHIQYHWRAASIRSWEQAYWHGELNKLQSKFWERKDYEELYDVRTDPHNVQNLANNPAYKRVLRKMRKVQASWSVRNMDVGLIPEVMIDEISDEGTIYEHVRQERYNIRKLLNNIDRMMRGKTSVVKRNLRHSKSLFRYWAVISCISNSNISQRFKDYLMALINDNQVAVQIAAAEALYEIGEKDVSLNSLIQIVNDKEEIPTLLALDVMEVMGDDAYEGISAVNQVLANKSKMEIYEIKASVSRLVSKFKSK